MKEKKTIHCGFDSGLRFVSIAMVFVNKTLLSGQASLDAPLFITWSQCVVTVASCYALTSLNLLVPVRVFSFPKLTLCLDTMKKVSFRFSSGWSFISLHLASNLSCAGWLSRCCRYPSYSWP